MRKMKETEIDLMLQHAGWATICTVNEDGTPYAVEATYFKDNDALGFMINPRGTTAKNIKARPSVLLKLTTSDGPMHNWAGVSLFGMGKMVTEAKAIGRGWDLLSAAMKTDYSAAKEKFIKSPEKSPFLRIAIEKRTGRCSARVNQEINWPYPWDKDAAESTLV
ncbi:MAG: pyridoxamine 5'-phosphate oxidase family protein [Desulfobacterales bacterium]|nr:pyridoxamine 5'-phosphate oxidase family protein [Desulfobacterales bacterium]